jgi:hypothetical protein
LDERRKKMNALFVAVLIIFSVPAICLLADILKIWWDKKQAKK